MSEKSTFIGIDLGTSGIRAIAINGVGQIVAEARTTLPAPINSEQEPQLWWDACCDTLTALLAQLDQSEIKAIAIDGTSGTLLLTDKHGRPLGPALMYNDNRSQAEAQRIAQIAPKESAAHGATSTLAKLLYLNPAPQVRHALHQADWIVGNLTGHYGVSDENNCLKLGYDAINRCWPAWLDQLHINRVLLPKVLMPGTPIAPITTAISQRFGLPANTLIVAGTTDSTAAFIATGAYRTGEAVTSLGSTLVMKVISTTPIFSPQHGVYSQPLGDQWLVGGGSNSGGAVLLHHFSKEELAVMTPKLKPEQPTGLDYYPLIKPGERFPISDATLPPCLIPRPTDDVSFFQGMLEGMARIELQGYKLLAELGAPYPSSICSAGGGANNLAWSSIRQQLLGVPFVQPVQQEAAYGTALLAKRGWGHTDHVIT